MNNISEDTAAVAATKNAESAFGEVEISVSRKTRDGDSSARMFAKRKGAGLCVRCKSPHDRGTNRCQLCTEKAVKSNAAIKKRASSSGLCSECRTPWEGSTLRCDSCKQKAREVWSSRSFGGVHCTRCSEPRDDKGKTCSSCREEQRFFSDKNRKTKFESGRCVQCGSDREGSIGANCCTCITKIAARRWLGDSERWPELKALLDKQGGLCAYTGAPISIGDNASVDHITPRSRGGSNTIENLQWLSWTVNRAKTDMTHDEFISMCALIANRDKEKAAPEEAASKLEDTV